MSKISALLFDLDGLLTDTETLHYEAYRQVFASRGYTLDEDFYCEHWIQRGLKIDEACAVLKISDDPATLRSEKMRIYPELVRTQLTLMPGAQEALERFYDRLPMALVTSAYADAAKPVLDAMNGWRYFDTVVTASDVTNLKPHPEPWLMAATRLQVAPENCLVIEDAEKGLVAASKAGMRSIAIPGRHTLKNDFTLATKVIKALDDLTFELIESL